jgi:succinate-acetate transporter protein
MFNVQARGITTPNVVLGMALGYGGLVQLIAGVEEFVCGNTFAATAFSSYGGFWLSFASKSCSYQFEQWIRVDMIAFYIPSLGVTTAYETEGELDSALAIYLSAWGIVTLIFLIVCFTPPPSSILYKYNQKLINNRHHSDLPSL